MKLSTCTIYISTQRYNMNTTSASSAIQLRIKGLLIMKPGIVPNFAQTPFIAAEGGSPTTIDPSLVTDSGIKIMDANGTTSVQSVQWVLQHRRYLNPTILSNVITNIQLITYDIATNYWINADNTAPMTFKRANTIVNLGRL